MIDDTDYMNENEFDDVNGMLDGLDYPTEEEQTQEKKKEPRPKGIGKYTFLSLLFALLSVGGLFLGLIGSFFKHPLIPASGIDGSLIGQFINILTSFGTIFEQISTAFSVSVSGGVTLCVELLLYLLPVVFALVSLILFIVSIATRKIEKARTCAYASAILTLISYGGIFLYTFAAAGVLTGTFGNEIIDYSCLIVTGVAFLVLFIASCVRSRRTGFLNALALLFTLVCAFAVYYPGTITSPLAFMAFDLVKAEQVFLGIAFSALLVVLFFNLIVSAFRLNAKKGLLFDTIRYGLQLLALILTVVATICYPIEGEDRWLIFKDTQLIATVILLALSIACLFIPLFTLIMRAAKRRAAEQQAAAEQYQANPVQDASYSGYDLPENYDGYQNTYAQPEQAEAQPQPEPQPQPQNDYAQPEPENRYENNYQSYNPYAEPAVNNANGYNYQNQMPQSEDVVVTIDTDDLQSLFAAQPEPPQPQPQPEPETLRYQAPEPEPEVLSSHEPVVIKEVIREVIKEKEPEPVRPELTEFERRMAALAKSNDAPKETSYTPPHQDKNAQRPRPDNQQNRQGFRQGFNNRPSQQNNPFARNNPRQDQQPFAGRGNEQENGGFNRGEPNYNVPAFAGRQPNSYVFGGSQYTYDPFINTLTPMEKNEFGDVFIANLYGVQSYLPAYIIGGDNREFFQTIFIHLGRFRGNISHELMEKIYAYVSKVQ